MTASTRPLKVMLIDDDEVDQLLNRRIIDRSLYTGEVLSFLYAEEALDHLRSADSAPADLIFLDINMPRMSGLEFLEQATAELGDEFAEVVVMLTTSLHPNDMERARKHSVVKAFFHKPLTAEQLELAVASLAK